MYGLTSPFLGIIGWSMVLAVAGGIARAYLMSKVFLFQPDPEYVKSFKEIRCLRKVALYETVERNL
ncbi:hypothetical protein D3C85_1874550 [compost metagenome]